MSLEDINSKITTALRQQEVLNAEREPLALRELRSIVSSQGTLGANESIADLFDRSKTPHSLVARAGALIEELSLAGEPATDRAFKTAIANDPDLDANYLKYADFLRANGEGERADFIEVQLRLSRLSPYGAEGIDLKDAETAFLHKHEKTWLAELNQNFEGSSLFISGVSFEKGIPTHVRIVPTREARTWPINVEALHMGVEKLLAANPQIKGVSIETEMFENIPGGIRFHSPSAETITAILSRPWMARMTSLGMGIGYCPEKTDVVEAIAQAPNCAQLTELRLGGNIGAQGAKALSSPDSKLRNVRALTLPECHIGGEGLAAIAAPGSPFGNLESLKLDFDHVYGAGIEAMAAPDSVLKNLKVLNLGCCSLTDSDLEVIAKSITLRKLQSFSFNGSGEGTNATVTATGIAALAGDESLLRSLRSLKISQANLNDDCLVALARPGSAMASLETLSLYGNNIGHRGAAALAHPESGIRNLQFLDLTINRNEHPINAGTVGLMTAQGSPLTSLVKLHLGNNGSIGNDGFLHLARPASTLAQLRELFIDQCGITRIDSIRDAGSALAELRHLKVKQGYSERTLDFTDPLQDMAHLTAVDQVLHLGRLQLLKKSGGNPLPRLFGLYFDASDRVERL